MRMILLVFLFFSVRVNADLSDKLLMGVVANGTLQQGEIKKSSGALDIAIAGEGYLALRDHDGPRQ